jgi:hypothetical protein
MKEMKKLLMVLLATGLLTLLSLSAVAYAAPSGQTDGNDASDLYKKGDYVPICHVKDHKKDKKVELIYVEFEDVEYYLDRGAFFPKIEVIKEAKDRAVVKLTCDKDDRKKHDKDKDDKKDKDKKDKDYD